MGSHTKSHPPSNIICECGDVYRFNQKPFKDALKSAFHEEGAYARRIECHTCKSFLYIDASQEEYLAENRDMDNIENLLKRKDNMEKIPDDIEVSKKDRNGDDLIYIGEYRENFVDEKYQKRVDEKYRKRREEIKSLPPTNIKCRCGGLYRLYGKPYISDGAIASAYERFIVCGSCLDIERIPITEEQYFFEKGKKTNA